MKPAHSIMLCNIWFRYLEILNSICLYRKQIHFPEAVLPHVFNTWFVCTVKDLGFI
jgi:hypothetical protein